MPLFKIVILTFILSTMVFSSNAQQPGGVGSPKYWYITENRQWKDIPSGTIAISDRNDTLNINFNQALKFKEGRRINNLNLGNKQTIVAVFHPEYPASGNTPSSKEFLTLKYHNGDFVTMRYNEIIRKFPPTTVKYGINSGLNFELNGNAKTRENALKIAVFDNTTTGCPNTTWGCDNDSLNILFKGYIPELMIYDRALNTTTKEQERITSYLAIKYGISLDLSTQKYLSSNGTTLLEAANMGKFNNRICAIGRDDDSGLWQPFSNTSYEEANISFLNHSNGNRKWENNRNITIGFTARDRNQIENKRFIFWGDDGGEVSLQPLPINNSEVKRIKREWLISNASALTANTTVDVSGKLKYVLQDNPDNESYFLLKLDGNIDKEDFFPLKVSAKYLQTDEVKWKNTERFTFGRVKKLQNTLANGNVYHEENLKKCRLTPSQNYIYSTKKTLFGKCKENFILYRTGKTIDGISCSNNPDRYVLETYFRGGIAPYSFTLETNDGNIEISENVDVKSVNDRHTCIIKCLEKGSYKLVIADFTNQKTTISVDIR